MRKNIISFLTLLLMLLILPMAQTNAQCEGDWAFTEGGAANETIWDLAVDDNGATYTIGFYDGTTVLGGQTYLNPSNIPKVFIQKYDSEGNLVWSKVPEMTGSVLNLGQTIHFDGTHLYVAFSFFGDLVYGSDVITDPNGSIILMKLDTAGNKVWHKLVNGDLLGNYITGITSDSEDNVYVTGRFRNDLYYGTELLGTSIINRAFLLKLDGEGGYLWHLLDELSFFSRGWPISVDAEDNVVFGGYFLDSLQLGNGFIHGEANSVIDFYIAKYDSEGGSIWLQPGYNGGNSFAHPYHIEVTEDAVYATGTIGDTLEIGGQTYFSSGPSDAFVVKYALSDGEVEWVKLLGATDNTIGEWGTGVFEKSNGNVLVVCQLQPNPIIDGNAFDGGFGQDIYLVEFDANGNYISASNTNISNWEESYALELKNDQLYVGGKLVAIEGRFGCHEFENHSMISGVNTEDAFLWKVDVSESPEQVVANFNFDATTDPVVSLEDVSEGDPACWEWNLGLDSLIGGDSNLVLEFDEQGSYIVCLEVSNCFSSDNVCIPFIIDNQGVPLANFAYNVEDDGLTVSFTDGSSNEPMTWIWVFDDGFESVEQNPEHTFEEYGVYEVCLSSSNSVGLSEASCQTIELIDPNGTALNAGFTYQETGLEYTFENQSLNAVTYVWDFGDGNSSNEENPVYDYSEEGVYEVCLMATNSEGETDEFCMEVNAMITSLESLSLANLNIAPQPMTDFTQLTFDGQEITGDLSIEVYNIVGEKVNVSYQNNTEGIKIYRNGLASGQYFFQLMTNKEVVHVGKLMVF